MIAWAQLRRMEAEATFCSRELRHTWACVRECTCGWAPIGMSHTRQAHSSCLFGVTLALELRNSFESIFEMRDEKGGMMTKKQLALLLMFLSPLMPQTQAEIKHVEMRVEGMT